MAYAAGDCLDLPIYGSNYIVRFPILDADGDPVSGAAGLDSEISADLGSFTDCTNEATEIGSSGWYYLVLTGTEMLAKSVDIQVKTSTTGAKTTFVSFNTARLSTLGSGTAQGGAAGSITLQASTCTKDNDLNGLYIRCSNNTPSGVQYQTRKIVAVVQSTQVASVDSNWGTNPSSSTTYEILFPVVSTNLTTVFGSRPASIAANGILDVNVKNINNVTAATPGAVGGILINGANTGASITFDTINVPYGLAVNGLTVTGGFTADTVTFSNTALGALTASDATINNLTIAGDCSIGATFKVAGAVTLNSLTVTNGLQAATLTVTGAVAFQSTFKVTGTTTFNAFTVTNDMTVSGKTIHTGAVSLGSTLDVTGKTTLAAVATGTIGTSSVTITGTLSTSGTATFNALTITNAFTVSGATVLTGAVTATSSSNSINLGADMITAGVIAADAIGSSELASSAVTEIQNGLALAVDLATVAGYVDTEVAAIKAKTDNLPSDPADASDIAGAFSAVNSTLSTIASYIDTEVASIKTTVEGLLDNLFKYDVGGGRTFLQCAHRLRHRNYVSAGVLYVCLGDDSTVSWQAALTVGATAKAVTDMDPA